MTNFLKQVIIFLTSHEFIVHIENYVNQKGKLMNKNAFTLAEVLITLGVIGVVAAMTIPTLIQNHKRSVVETRLAKFYSTINQAFKMSEIDNSEPETWDELTKTNAEEWYNKYLAKYLKSTKIETSVINNGRLQIVDIYFSDGSYLQFASDGPNFYPIASNKLKAKRQAGKDYFPFIYKNGAMIPYENADEEKYGCRADAQNPALCTKLIQENGWKIPKDYPFRF